MSDWNAVYYPAAAINAGNDLAMPGPIGPEALTKAAEEGSLNLTCLAESAARVEKLVRTYARPAEGEINLSKTDKAAYDAAAEGIVLLKNEAAILPLSSSSKIALYGKFVENLLTCGAGSAGAGTFYGGNDGECDGKKYRSTCRKNSGTALCFRCGECAD